MTTTAIRIVEAASAEEIEDVRTLFREYAASLGWDRDATPWFCEEIDALPGPYAPPRGSLLLAFVGDSAAGALGLRPVPEDARVPGIGAERFGELKRLFVRPEFRRRGVGRALMERSEAEARERGYASLVLTTAEEMFPLAPPLYETLGYVETQPYRDDMPYPQIRWMRKDL